MSPTQRFQDRDLPLSGSPPAVGDTAPSVTLSPNPVEPLELSFPRHKPLILCTAPSLDTPVCGDQLRLFDNRLTETGAPFDFFFVTRDLPFAQQRFADQQELGAVTILSDFKFRHLGDRFGLELPDMGLLARTVFVIDADGSVRYREIVPEISALPDLDAAWSVVTATV